MVVIVIEARPVGQDGVGQQLVLTHSIAEVRRSGVVVWIARECGRTSPAQVLVRILIRVIPAPIGARRHDSVNQLRGFIRKVRLARKSLAVEAVFGFNAGGPVHALVLGHSHSILASDPPGRGAFLTPRSARVRYPPISVPTSATSAFATTAWASAMSHKAMPCDSKSVISSSAERPAIRPAATCASSCT